MDHRVRKLNSADTQPTGKYVLYWMRSAHRAESNHALAFATDLANHLDLPLLAAEGLSCDYPYASDRLHSFRLEAAAETGAAFRRLGAGYAFHLARRRGEPDPIAELAAAAAAAVTDEVPETLSPAPAPPAAPAFFAVDSMCIVPSGAIGAQSYAAYSLRPKIHRLLPHYLSPVPQVKLRRRFTGETPPFHTEIRAGDVPALAADCEIDHGVAPALGFRGGRREALRRLAAFLDSGLARYSQQKNDPAARATSDLSPYLRSGVVSALEIALAAGERARAEKLIADEFLEEMIVRRELAFNFARYAPSIDSLEALPAWARKTLDAHRSDRREALYSLEQFESASTGDALWNATQLELLLRGKIHGYYRMYWGKKIFEWSATPEEALGTMLYLNNRYALDGQNPASFASILWCLGLHDRPWPQRPIYGAIRSMSRAGMDRKTDVPAYIAGIEALAKSGKRAGA